MKKFSCVILSFILAFSVGSVQTFATEDIEGVTSYEGSEEDVDQQKSGDDQVDEVEPVEENSKDTKNGKDDPLSILAENADEAFEEDQDSEEDANVLELLDEVQDETGQFSWREIASLSLKYDDRYSLDELLQTSGTEGEYTISEIIGDSQSYQVVSGEVTDTKDEVITQISEDSLDIVATGIGTATIYLVPANQGETDEPSEGADEPSEETDNGGNTLLADEPDPVENGLKVNVTVEPAALTLMYLVGQSNMEGQCSSSTGYELNASVACEEGNVYSTYAPTTSTSEDITGIYFDSYCNVNNAADFVAEALQSDASLSGESLAYPLNSLTAVGLGKTGPDSGLAYEWNTITGDKVWVINTAWSGTDIANWIPGTSYYDRSAAVWDCVRQVYQAEIDAGHYETGERLAFWLQGETGDKAKTEADYMAAFATMSSAMKEELDLDALGIIMVRASTGSYTNEDEWVMTGPRIAQYIAGGSEGLSDVYVVSNANEQWVSDAGVEAYFQSAYPGGTLNYPMHGNTKSSLPTTVNEVHSDVHYSQIGHNENGITAAYGMHEVLEGNTVPSEVQWRNEDGKTIDSLSFEMAGNSAVLIPVSVPVYAAKQVTYSVSGDVVSYDGSTGIVRAKKDGESEVTAFYDGSKISSVLISVNESDDLSGVAGKDYTGIYYYKGTWWYLVDGIIQTDFEGVEPNENGWWYINKGKVDFSYTGFAENSNGWWYIEDGKVTFEKNSVIQDTNKKIDGTTSWWYVVESKVQKDFTGLADYPNSNGWWYISDGKVTFDVETVAQNKNGWYYVKDSKVDFSYNDFAENNNGWWYIENGAVTFNQNSVIQGTVNEMTAWWYVVGSKVQTDYTGVADYSNSYGWWYIKDGKVDFSANTVAKNKNGWWYVKDGAVDFSYNGFAENENGWWYIENGKVNFDKDSVIQGIVNGENAWWYVVGGQVQTDFTGLADYSNSNGWWYINDGKVTFNVDTVANNKNGWWYIKDSKADFSYNGFAENSNGWWYLEDGKVTFNKSSVIPGTVKGTNAWWYVVESKVQTAFTGLADYSNANGWWYINDGKVTFDVDTVAQNKNGWWYVKDSKVDFGYKGIASNENGSWYIEDGKVNFSYNGDYTNDGVTYKIINGKVQN